jgi:signal peptidase II
MLAYGLVLAALVVIADQAVNGWSSIISLPARTRLTSPPSSVSCWPGIEASALACSTARKPMLLRAFRARDRNFRRLGGLAQPYRAALGGDRDRLVIGGAIGNVVDRLRFGAVVDFLDFHWGEYHWPAFNIADSRSRSE